MEFTHYLEPYGRVELVDCKVLKGTQFIYDERGNRIEQETDIIIGTVKRSFWISGFVAGVAIKPATEHPDHPAGSQYAAAIEPWEAKKGVKHSTSTPAKVARIFGE
jgi:hypothetical protein